MQIESQMLETISEELSEANGDMDNGLGKADSFPEGQSSPNSSAGLPSEHERCIQVSRSMPSEP